MKKKLYFLSSTFILMIFFSGCKTKNFVFSDIAGTWDFTFIFSVDTCTPVTTMTHSGFAVITRNDSTTDTTTGVITIYLEKDPNLTCPIWTLNYTLDTSGTMTVNQTAQVDPLQCAPELIDPNSWGDVRWDMIATDVEISGNLAIDYYDIPQTWTCMQRGDITFNNKR